MNRDRLTKQEAFSTGYANDIIDYLIWEYLDTDPDTLTREQYNKVKIKMYEITYQSLVEQK